MALIAVACMAGPWPGPAAEAEDPPAGLRPERTLETAGQVDFIDWSPDGTTLAVVHRVTKEFPSDAAMTVWDVRAEKPAPRKLYEGIVLGAAVSPDGKTLAFAVWEYDRKTRANTSAVRLHSTATGEKMGDLPGLTIDAEALGFPYESDLMCVAFSPDGRWAAAGTKLVRAGGAGSGEHQGGEVCVWDTRTGKIHWQDRTTHTDNLHAVAFAPDGRTLASGGRDKVVRLWDVETGRLTGSLFGPGYDGVASLGFSADGKHLIAGGSGEEAGNSVFVWDLAGRKLVRRLGGFQPGSVYAACAKDGTVWAVGEAGSGKDRRWRLRSWDLATGREKLSSATRPGGSRALALAPDGKTVAVGTSTGVALFAVP